MLSRLPPGLGAVVLAFALATLPILAAGPVPALCDYPNHLARMAILAHAGTPAANPFYRQAWALYPNLAMDLIVPPLARWIGPIQATRLFLLASQALIVAGAATLERVVKGRLGWAGSAAAMGLYSLPFAWGFVNFEFALGLALFAFAGWIALYGRPVVWRFSLHVVACGVLFVGHLFALGLYGWAVGVYTLWRWRREREPLSRLAMTALVLAAPLVPLIIAAHPFAAAATPGATQWDFLAKAFWLVSLDGYSRPLSVLLSAMLLGLTWLLASRGRLRLEGAGPALGLGFLALFLVMPHRLLDTEFVDVRVVAAAALILPAFTIVEPPSGRMRALTAGVLGAVAAVLFCDVMAVQLSYRGEYRRLFASFDDLPAGARVLVGVRDQATAPLAEYPMVHGPVMAAGFAGAFVPTLFAYPGKQPIAPRPDMLPLSNPNGGDTPQSVLVAAAKGVAPPAPYRFAADWPKTFDALYMVGPPGPNPLPGTLQFRAAAHWFTLYKIIRPAPARLTGPADSPPHRSATAARSLAQARSSGAGDRCGSPVCGS